MIESSALATSIKDKLSSLTDEQKRDIDSVHDAWASGVQEYIEANLKFSGAYIGTIPGPAPDTLSGTYSWSVNSFVLEGSTLKGAAATSFNTWVTAFETALKAISFAGADDTEIVTLATPIVLTPLSLSISQADLNDIENADAGIDIIAEDIATNILATVVTTLTAEATSSGSGTGTVTGITLI